MILVIHKNRIKSRDYPHPDRKLDSGKPLFYVILILSFCALPPPCGCDDRWKEGGQLYAYHVAAYSAGGRCYNEGITAITRIKGLVMVTPRVQTGGEADAAQTMVDSLPSVADVDPDILQDADALSRLEEQIREVKDALSVPATVTINRASYRVTAVGSGAFTGYKKVKKLTISQICRIIEY